MLVEDKPPLDDELLAHFGIPGMKWGQRKGYIPVGRPGGARPAPQSQQSQGHALMKKLAIGGGIVAGVAAGAYLLSKTGTRPSARAMTSRSNAAGLKMTMGLLKRTGKMSLSGIKGMPKVAKVGGKAAFKTTRFVGKQAGSATKRVAVNSTKTTRDFIEKMRSAPPSGPAKVRGEKFGKLLLGQYGTRGLTSGGGLAYVPNRLPRRDQGWHGSE